MIPEIGVVVAAYVITRMVELFASNLREFRGVWSVVVMTLAVVTVVIAGFVAFDLVVRGVSGISPASDLNPIR